MNTRIQSYNRRHLEKRVGYSQAVLAGEFPFISGCVSWDLEGKALYPGDFPAQVTAVYSDIDATLKAYGMAAADVIKETVFTTDMDALVAANGKRMEYYQHSTPPASTWVEIKRLVDPELLLEVEIVAFKKLPPSRPH
jgi:2-iminobutanoate/2-iminopropanoate deaminase